MVDYADEQYMEDMLESEYGAWWMEEQRLPPVIQCHICGGRAWLLESDGMIDCENCGKRVI